MSSAGPEVIERSAERSREWVNEVANRLGEDDPRRAYRALLAVLHTLRDRMPVNEAAQFAAQLPEFLRGAFYQDWVPAHTPMRYRDHDEFLERIARAANLAGTTEASYELDAVMGVIRNHVSAGEIEDVIAVMPRDIAPLLTAESPDT